MVKTPWIHSIGFIDKRILLYCLPAYRLFRIIEYDSTPLLCFFQICRLTIVHWMLLDFVTVLPLIITIFNFLTRWQKYKSPFVLFSGSERFYLQRKPLVKDQSAEALQGHFYFPFFFEWYLVQVTFKPSDEGFNLRTLFWGIFLSGETSCSLAQMWHFISCY